MRNQEQGLDDWKGLLEGKKLGQQEIDLCLKKNRALGSHEEGKHP